MKGLIRDLFISSLFLLLPAAAIAQTVTWTGAGDDNNWSTSGNWSGGVPDAADAVLFDGTSNKECVIDAPASVLSFKVSDASTVTFTADNDLSVVDGFVMSSGVFNAGSSQLNVGGDIIVKPQASFNAGTGKVVMTGTNAILGFAGGQSLRDLTISGDIQTGAGVSVNGVLTVDPGKRLYISPFHTVVISGAGTLSLSGTIEGAVYGGYTGGRGILELQGLAASSLVASGELNSDVRFNASYGNIDVPARAYGGSIEIYSESAHNRTAVLGDGVILSSGGLTVITENSGGITVDAEWNNPDVTVAGGVGFSGIGIGTGTLLMGEGTWSMDEGYDFTGGVVSGSSTISLYGSGTAVASLGGAGSGMENGVVYALAVYEGKLIAGGSFTNAGGDDDANRIARWTGSNWESLGGPGSGLGGTVRALTVYKGELIAAGGFTNAGGDGENYIARWTGTSWESLGGSGSGLNSIVFSLAIHEGYLIAAGVFTGAGGDVNANRAARWTGTSWESLGGPGSGIGSGAVNTLAIHNGELIAGGSFTNAGVGSDADYIARLTDSGWESLGSGLNNTVRALTVHNGHLIAGGSFTGGGGDFYADYIARWSGNNWESLGGAGSGLNNAVLTFAVHNGRLIAGGAFTGAGADNNANRAALWTGTGWKSIGGSGSGFGGNVWTLLSHRGRLIAGGAFTVAGTDINANRIALCRVTRLVSAENSIGGLHITGDTPYLLGDTLSITGDFTAEPGSASFSADTEQEVHFTGAGVQNFSGSATFYALTKTLPAGSTLQFEAGSIVNVTEKLHFEDVFLRSDSDDNAWYLNCSGEDIFVDYVDVKDSDASGGNEIIAYNSTDSGNNTNWIFIRPYDLIFDPVYQSSMTVSWSFDWITESGFILEASTEPFAPVYESSSTADTSARSLSIGGLHSNTTYYIRVGALYDRATSWSSPYLSTSTLAEPVTGARIYSVFLSSVTLNWQAHPELPLTATCSGYTIEASTSNFSGGTVYSSSTYDRTLSTLTVAGLDPGTIYWFRIGAYNWGYTPNYTAVGSTRTLSSELWSVQDGAWDDPSTWDRGVAPDSFIVVNITHTVTYSLNSAEVNCSGVKIGDSGILQFDQNVSTRSLIVGGDIRIGSGGKLLMPPNTGYMSIIKIKSNTDGQRGLIIETGGEFEMKGNFGQANAVLSSYDTNCYNFLSSGTVNISNFNINYLTGNGMVLHPEAFIIDISSGVFDNIQSISPSSSTYINAAGLTSNATFYNLTFNNSGNLDALYNISAAGSGINWVIIGFSGPRSGEYYDKESGGASIVWKGDFFTRVKVSDDPLEWEWQRPVHGSSYIQSGGEINNSFDWYWRLWNPGSGYVIPKGVPERWEWAEE